MTITDVQDVVQGGAEGSTAVDGGSEASGVTVTVPTQREMVAAIMRELSGATRDDALGLIEFLAVVRDEIREVVQNGVSRSGMAGVDQFGRLVYHLNGREIEAVHETLVAIMPDDAIARPGSAHDVLNRGLLDFEHGELTFKHSMGGRRLPRDCVVVLEVQTFVF